MNNVKSFTIRLHNSLIDALYYFLLKSVTNGDYVIREYRNDRLKIYYDLYLPCGSEKLGIPPKTVIEVKSRISYNTIESCLAYYNKIKDDKDVENFIVVYENSNNKDFEDEFVKDGIHFYSYKSFIAQNKQEELFDDIDIIKGNIGQNDWLKEREVRIRKANSAFHQGRNTFFIGAGVSMSAGLPSWGNLLLSMLGDALPNECSKCCYKDLDTDSDNSSIIKGRYLKLLHNTNKDFVDSIRNALLKPVRTPSKLVEALGDAIATGAVNQLITYNYDDLMEDELQKRNIPYTTISKSGRLTNNTLPIYHVHGYIPVIQTTKSYNVDDVRLSEDSYHEIYKDSYHWSNVEQLHALSNSTCFFIGLSMKDPNLRRLLDFSTKHGDEPIYHFAILSRNEYKRHQYTERIFEDMEVQIIWYQDYNEIPSLINQICQ